MANIARQMSRAGLGGPAVSGTSGAAFRKTAANASGREGIPPEPEEVGKVVNAVIADVVQRRLL